MRYNWYEIVRNSDELTQGDIIEECPIPSESSYRDIHGLREIAEGYIEVKNANLIVLSQACDIEHEKIDSVVLSPVWTLDTLISSNNYY